MLNDWFYLLANAAAGPLNANDRVRGNTSGTAVTAYNYSLVTTDGCAPGYSPGRISSARPVTRFARDVAPTPVEATAGASRTWDLHTGRLLPGHYVLQLAHESGVWTRQLLKDQPFQR